ncbi:MAG: hypothetical protein NTV94_09410 [Planctomycetota bacterium]|nr:hypothetical protein [Planctomycetota bacterium]
MAGKNSGASQPVRCLMGHPPAGQGPGYTESPFCFPNSLLLTDETGAAWEQPAAASHCVPTWDAGEI